MQPTGEKNVQEVGKRFRKQEKQRGANQVFFSSKVHHHLLENVFFYLRESFNSFLYPLTGSDVCMCLWTRLWCCVPLGEVNSWLVADALMGIISFWIGLYKYIHLNTSGEKIWLNSILVYMLTPSHVLHLRRNVNIRVSNLMLCSKGVNSSLAGSGVSPNYNKHYIVKGRQLCNWFKSLTQFLTPKIVPQ